MKNLLKIYGIFFLLVFLLPYAVYGFGNVLMKPMMMDTPPSPDATPNTEVTVKNTKKITTYITAKDQVAEMDLEEYLKGTVAAEMPAAFPDEALKAQAVAARTYVINRANAGDPDGVHKGADVCDNPAHCKAWQDKDAALAKWNPDQAQDYWDKISNAVQSTAGEIITYNSQPVSAVFYAISSGKTENAKDVWGNDVPYLKSVESPYDVSAPGYASSAAFTVAEFKENLLSAQADMVLGDDPSQWVFDIVRTEGGGVQSFSIGGVTISGVRMRTLFGLRSANFDLTLADDQALFDVKGYGHGVGMSQWGARYFAEQGKNYREIIAQYYTGVEIEKLS